MNDTTPWISVDQIRPHPSNPNEHTPEQIQKIARSIDELDWGRPIILSSDNYILIGHGAYEAAVDILSLKKVPYRRTKHKHDSHEAIALMLSDNKLAELSNWNYGKLQPLQHNLEIAGFDTTLTGFENTELEEIDTKLANLEKIVEDDFDPDDVTESTCQLGDVWQLGNHRLMCGDSTVTEDVEQLMDNNIIDLFFTDPPYGVSYADKNAFLNAIAPANRIQTPIDNDHKSINEMKELWLQSFINALNAAKKGASYYICGPQGGELMMMMMILEAGWELKHTIIWVKNNHVLGRSDYNYKHEPLIYGWKEGGHKFYSKGSEVSVWEIDKPHKSDLHPTMKPIELCSRAIHNSTLINENVLDLFGGSGSTLIACEQLQRKCYMMELDPHYCDVIIKRWEDFTGQKAHKMS
jgi:site-specific DNA-methyltransferase (adenine-specific)